MPRVPTRSTLRWLKFKSAKKPTLKKLRPPGAIPAVFSFTLTGFF